MIRPPRDWIAPRWLAGPAVCVLSTTRAGGVSVGRFAAGQGAGGGLNLATHVGDEPEAVALNRAVLRRHVPGPPVWLEQVHGISVFEADMSGVAASPTDADAGRSSPGLAPPVADAAVTSRPGQVLAVLTADCLPVVLADAHAAAVGVAHAGWRGLAAGVLEATVSALRARAREGSAVTAWLGPAIGPAAFEVGADVRQAFCDRDPRSRSAFRPGHAAGKWWCDLYALARMRLADAGVVDVHGGGYCTVNDAARFYSYRRDGVTGRMATLAWLDGDAAHRASSDHGPQDHGRSFDAG